MSDRFTLAARLEDTLYKAASVDRPVAPVSLVLDYGADGEGEPLLSATVDRTTKSLVFVQGSARLPDGRTALSAQGVFRVVEP